MRGECQPQTPWGGMSVLLMRGGYLRHSEEATLVHPGYNALQLPRFTRSPVESTVSSTAAVHVDTKVVWHAVTPPARPGGGRSRYVSESRQRTAFAVGYDGE